MHVEPLEDRSMLTLLVVDPSNLSDYSSINLAIAAANTGDTIQVVAGTYNEQVNVNKSLTIEGAQAGIDARTRSGAESIVDGNSGTTAFVIGADDVTIDGFTVQDQTNVNVFGAGIWVQPGHHGTHIVNDIVQNNVVGLFLSNDSAADPAIVQHDLFQNNNQPGAASGTAIYLDQYTGGTVDGVEIDSNKIVGNANAGIGFSSTDPTNHPTSDVSITNNQIDSNGRGIYLYSTSNAVIQGNDITNSTTPTDGGSSVGIGLYGDDNNVAISGNNITGGAKYGVRIGGFGTNPNTNVTINGNGIFGNGLNDLQLDDVPPGSTAAYTGVLDATRNYWGTTTDTTIASRIADPHNQVAFSPFLNNPDQNPGQIGFQADFGSVTATTLGVQLPAVGPIEAAILAAAPGATVTVNAGTYIENDIVITQGIQLIANGAVTIKSPSAAAGTGVTINAGAANVTLQGFTLTGFATGISATSANSLLLKDDTLDVSNTNGASISGVASLNVTSTSGANQLVVLTGGSPSSNLLFAGQDAIDYSGLTNLAINTGSGSNFLKVDFSGGNPIPSAGLSYNGGSGASSGMLLDGGSFSNEVYTPSGAHAGTIQFDSSTLTYSGLAPIADLSNATTLTINGTAAGEPINVVDGPNVGGFQTTEVNSGVSGTFELVDFANKTIAVVNGAGGADAVVVNNPNAGAGLTSLALTVNGAGSTVAVDAAATPVSVNNLAVGSATASVTVGNGTLSGIMGDVTVSGAVGSTSLVIDDSADGTGRNATVTSSQTSGLAASGAVVKYTAADLSSFTINGGTAGDTFSVTGTPAGATNAINAGGGDNQFFISGGGLGSGSTNSFTSLGGDDTFNVSGPLNAPASISAGSQATADVLNYDAGGHSVVLTANSITAGTGQTLTFAGIEGVNITDVAGVTVNGDNNANHLTLSQTSPTTDAYSLDGGPLVTFSSSATSFAFNGLGGADSLSVDNSGGLLGIPIAFAGGAGFDSLLVGGNAGSGVSAVYSQTGSDATGFAGSIVYSGGVTEAISFTGLSPVETLTPVTSLTINDSPGAAAENIVTGPTSTGVDPFLATTATTYQVNYGGSGEPINWRNATTVTVNGSSNSDTITENLPTQVDAGSPNQLTTLNINAGGSTDEIDVLATPSGVVTNTDTQVGVPDRTVIGGTFANFNNATGSTAAILGAVNVSDSGGVGQLYVDDSGGADPDSVTLTNSSIVGAAPVTIGYEPGITAVQLALTAQADTVNVLSTNSQAVTTLFGNNGDDTFNVSSTAPAANGNGTLTGNLSGILGELNIASGAGNDSLNVSDYGGVGRNYTVADLGVGVTQISASGIANIAYNLGGGLQLEHFNLVGASVGGNTYNIDNTTATASNVVGDGDASASGNSTFNIQADHLRPGASNSFNGFAGDDLFNLNFAMGGVIAAGATLSVNGGGLASGNDRVNVNANQAGDGSRTIGLNYQSNATSDVQITGLGTAGGTIGVVGARQINYYGDAGNDDTVSVSGAASGNNTLSVTPLSASSANVFLGGNPLLTIPPGSTGSNNPGVAGGGAGPDLFVGGVALAGFSVNGGSTGAGNGNRLVVNGKTEVIGGNNAQNTSAWGGNAFGSPADTVTAGNGYDQIDVSDSAVSINNNALGALLTVNYAAGSFANPSPTQAAVTVNGGDESTPAAGVADDLTVHLSPAIHFQINGGAPPTGSAPNGDRLNVLTPNDAEIWSDAATPPNVSITSSGALPVSYNSIEELALTPGNGIVNIYGDNNVSGGAQNDGYRVVGTGPNAFSLQISGDKNNPASYSSPIQIFGVTTLNAFGEAKGVDNTGADINALYVTPWANNTPQGWGVQTFWDQGDKNHDGDLLVYNGVAGVSENINVQPSASEAGQLFSMNAASGTPIAVINYTLNTSIIVNGNDGSAGDTDTLTLNGTDPNNPGVPGSPGTSGQDDFVANFAAAGTPADPMVTVTDKGSLPPGLTIYTLQSLSNINTVNVNMQGGSDFFELKSGRSNGSLTVNVNGGAPSGAGNLFNTDAVRIDGTAGTDAIEVSPGATSDAGRVAVQLTGATAPTVLNFTTMENVVLSGGGGPDAVTLDGTGSNDSFALANGTAQVNANAPILLSGFGLGSFLNLNGLGGENSFAIDQATGSMFANVIVSGGPSGDSSASITGTSADDAISFTPFSANSGLITVNSGAVTHYFLAGVTSASVDALGQTTGDSLKVTTAGTYVNTPGAQPGSGTVQVTLPSNIATLPLSYANVENVSFSGTTLVVNGTSGNDHVDVAADGSVTVNGNPLSTAGFSALVLNLNGGTDSVSIAAGANFSGGILVNGAGQTSVSVTGTAGNDTIGVDAATGQVTGIVTGPIRLVGVQNLTVNGGGAATGDAISVVNLGMPGGLQSINVAGNGAAGDTLQVSGSGGPDNMLVTPTGATNGSLQDSGVGPVVNFSSFTAAGALQVTANALTVDGSAGNDSITVTEVSPTVGRVTVAGDLPVNYNASAAALNIMGLGGSNSLTVDSSSGAVTTPIYYDGGSGSNSLTLTGGLATSDLYSPGPAAGQGLDTLVIGGNTESVHFVNLAPVTDNVAGPLVVNGTNGDDAITAGASPNVVSVNNLETISFANKTSLTLNGLAGNDSFAITPSNISIGGGAITVNGAAGANSALTVNGAGAIGYNPAGPASGNVTVAGDPTVQFANIASAAIVGDGAGDTLTLGSAGNLFAQFIAGATADSGILTMQFGSSGPSATPVSFSNLGFSGGLSVLGGGFGSLDINGPNLASNFTVSPAGVVQIFKPLGAAPETLPITTTDAAVRLIGHSGSDTFTVPGNQPFAFGLQVQGASGNNTLNFNGDGTAPVTVDLANHTVQETGFGSVSLLGVQTLNVVGGNQLVTINDDASSNSLDVTPTGSGSAQLQIAGQSPVLNLSGAAALSVVFTPANNDQLVVNGTGNGDTILASSLGVGIAGLVAVNQTGANSIAVNGLGGADTFNVAPGATPIYVNGGDPIGTQPGDTLNVATSAGITVVGLGTDPTSGTITTSQAPVGFTGVESVNLNNDGTGTLLINGTNGNDAINQSGNTVTVNNGAVIGFSNYASLTLDGNNGDDTFNVSPASLAGVAGFTVNGGDPTASDKLIVNGTSGVDAITFAPTSADAGSITVGAAPAVSFTTVESVSINGQGGQDALTYQTPANGGIGSELTYTPGANPDSGTVTGDQFGVSTDLAPLSFANLGTFGSVRFTTANSGRTDHLVVNGTGDSDIFNVLGGSLQILKNQPANIYTTLPMTAPGVAVLDLNGLAGDDTFNLQAPLPYSTVVITGSGAADPPAVNLTGDGSSLLSITLGAASTIVSGGGLGTVSISGVGIINASNAGGDVTLVDPQNATTLDVTPTSATGSTSTIEGSGLTVNTTNSGAFNVSFTVANDNLVVNGTTGPDTIDVSGTQVNVHTEQAVNLTGAGSLTVNGAAGSDTFNVAAAAIPIHINGGDPIGVLPGDTLNLLAGGNPVQFFAGPHVDEGGFVVGANAEISYQQIESIGSIINPGPVLIVGTNGDDDIQVIARDASYITSGPVPPGLDGSQDFTVSVNQGPNLLFVDATQGLFIDALSGDDQVDVRAPAPNGAPWNMLVTVAGGAPAGQPGLNGDDFTLETPGSSNSVFYQPSGADTGLFRMTQTAGGPDSTAIVLNSFTIPAPPLVKPYVSSAGGFESVTYDGQGGANLFGVEGAAGGNNTFTSTPGAADNAGTMAVDNLLPVSYKNLGPGSNFGVLGASGTNSLVVNGTAGGDNFAVSATGAVSVNNRIPVQQAFIGNLVLNGLGGDNTYSIAAGHPYSTITVNGSGNSDPDVLNLTGNGSSPVSVNLGGPTQTVSGGGLGTVNITGVGIVNLGNAGGDINVLGTSGPDNLSVTPTGANSATIQDGALAPVLNTTNTGALNILEGTAGDGDTVTVHGTGNADTINVSQAATTTVQVGAWKQIDINAADVEALVVDGGLGADIFNVSGTGGPALTIAGGQTPAADTLNLATVNATVTYGTNPSSGAIDPGLGPNSVIHFSDLQAINLTGNGSGSLVVNGTSGDDAIQQLNDQVTVNGGAAVAFGGYANLTLDGAAANDHFLVNPTTLSGVSTFNVNGGVSTSGDSLTVNGTSAQDTILFLPGAANQGNVTVNAAPTVDFQAIGSVSINGQGGNDQLTTTTLGGPNSITYSPGATIDSASVQVGSLVPMSFSNLGPTGRVRLANSSGNPVDSLLYNGTAGNDSFGVNATGIVFLNGQLPLSIPGIANLTLDGQSGVNAYSVAGNVAIPVNVNGGSSAAGNTLTVLGDGSAPLTVDLGNRSVQEAGFGLIGFNGVSQVNVDAAGQNIDVVGGVGDDSISYTPTGTQAGTLQDAGLNAVFSLTTVGALSLDPQGGTNTVTVDGNSAGNTIDVGRGVNTSVQVDGLLAISIVSADAQALVIDSGLGDDTINVSGSTAAATPALEVDGGSPAASDSLNVTTNGFTSVFFGANLTSGTIGAASDPAIAFSNIEAIALNSATNSGLNFWGTNGNDAINVNENVISLNGGATVAFANYPTLNLFGQSGDDTFNVWPTTLAGVNAISVDGGDPTASDKLIVNGSSSADDIGYNPTGADSGNVTIAGSPTVNFTTTESVVINGQGGADTLTYTTPSVSDGILSFTPGATANSGSVSGRLADGTLLAPLSFTNIDSSGLLKFAHEGVTLPSGAANDTLVVNGTAGDDLFAVSGASIALEKQAAPSPVAIALPIEANSISSLTLSGQGGNDTFDLSGTSNYAGVFVQGNGTVDPSVTNLTGDGTAINLNVGGVSTIVTGGGLGTVTITGNQILNLDAAGGAVTTTDSAGPNTLDVTPTGSASATLQVEGQAPVVNLTNSGAFNVNFSGAGDSLVVDGTSGVDMINASGSQVTVNALLAVNYAGATALTVNGSTGADTFNVTPDATVAIHVNGGDPIGVLPGDVLNIVAGGSPVSFFAGPHSDEGGFQVGSDAAVSFQQIESIGPIVGPGPVLILGTNGDDDIQVIARDQSYITSGPVPPGLDGVQDFTVSVNAGPNLLFINAPQLYIDALSGDDQVDVRAPAPNHAAWNTQVTIAGGAPAGQPSLNGDTFSLETPGAGNSVTYQPTATDGGVFTFSSSTITLTSAPFTIPAINYTSSAGGFENATYDGQGAGDALTILGTAGNDTITHTAGAANDAGTFAVNSLLPLDYKNLGAGSITVNGNGASSPDGDTLVVDGTANNDAFSVDGTTGTVHLNSRVAIGQTGITNLVLNGYNPNNTFTLNASLPYASTAVNSIDPATLTLNGTAGAETIGVDLTNSQITGFGGTVSFVGVATVNMNGNGGADSLSVNGTTNDDVITYKPTSAGGGTFSLAGLPVNFNFNIGAGNVFTVNGGGGNGGDEVDVLGNNAGSVITVDSPNRTVSVENALNVVLMPVVLGTDVQVASVAGGLGNNTFLVIPARNIPSGNDIVGPGFLMPNNLLVHVNGGAVPANAALVVADTNGATLDSSLFAVVNRTSNTSGVVRLFQSTGGPEPIQYPDISYANVGIVQASTAVNATTHQQQTLTMGPDTSDPNGSLNNAAYLGSGASINATNLTIFPNALEHRFLQAEQDWFRVVAQFTGTMDFQVYFKQYAGFLPGGGELQIQVYDAAGNQITNFGINDSTGDDQRRRIPVVAGETYYLQVYGITQNPAFTPADGFDSTNATVNAYSLSITNTPAPTPDSLGLNNIVAQGSVNNAIAPTTTTFAASNAALPPPPTQPLPPLSSINNFYVGKYLEFISGALIGQRQLVTAYVGATQTFTFASGFSAAPAVGDKFQIESDDTGRTQFDNVTRDNTPTIYIRLDAANTPTDGLIDLQGGGSGSQTPPNNTPILIPFWAGNSATPPNSPANNGSFRVAVYDNTNPQSPIFLGYANAVPGQSGVFQLQVTTALAEGSHILAAKVEIDSPTTPSNKDLSAAATFQMVVDTLAPPVYFGSPTTPNSGLLGSSDTGVSGQPATIVDRITADSTPTLYGVAEANAVVRLYDDVNNNGVVDNGDIFLGMAAATPTDGTNQFPSGQWQITSSIDLNNPTRGFPLDGVRHLLVTAEDAAGNVSAPQALTIFLDTQGPIVKNVSVNGSPSFNLFAIKANTTNPTPLVNALDITFNDQPVRVGPSFVYPAVNPILATTAGNYLLVGEATGPVAITSVTFSDSTASGTPGMSVATLHFAAPLPDDRYTLTISESITDNAGNKLDGEFGPTFPSGNGKTGGQFLGQFTVDSRPELATFSSGSVSVDLNGNFLFDPQNVEQTNRDAVFSMGFSTDRLFAGKFADTNGVVNGFDKMGAYGFLNGQWRWLLDLNGDGAISPAAGDLSIVEPLAIDGLPVAGNWTNNPALGAQVGLFDGTTWWLDVLGHHTVDAADVAAGGKLTGDMRGLPIVGDFDGDGRVDLGTYSNGVFYFDLSSKDPGGKLTGNYNATINVQTDLPNNIGFAGVLARPVAADMNQDGTTDIGLFVPGRTQNNSPSTAEWYWLMSNAPAGSTPQANFDSLNHPFDPTPLGHDLYAQFGSQFALPLVGNFDPPANGSSGGGTVGGQSSNGWIQNLYLDVLGRSASSDEVTYWTNAVNHGITPSQIAMTFLTSTEHRSQLINTLYEQYLGRQADQAGINFWIGIWNATGGPEAVQAGIIGSPEYYAKAGGTDTGWVTALYQNILGRAVDPQGLAYWTDFIKTHSKQSVVLGFVTSDEYRLNLINGWFQVYLGRQIDAAGAQFWLNAMKAGMTQEQIEAGILGSQEFLSR